MVTNVAAYGEESWNRGKMAVLVPGSEDAIATRMVVEGVGKGACRRANFIDDGAFQEPQHQGVFFQAEDRRGGVVGVGDAPECWEELLARASEPLGRGDDVDAADAEGREDPSDIGDEGAAGDDDEEAIGAETLWRVVVEVGDAVEGHGGLARARSALEHDEAASGVRDQVELLGIDEGGDLWEVLIGAEDGPAVDPEAAAFVTAAQGRRARGFALAARELGDADGARDDPGPLGGYGEGALRTADPLEVGVIDGNGAAG